MGKTILVVTELLPLEDFSFATVFENKLLKEKLVKIQSSFKTKILYFLLFQNSSLVFLLCLKY